jgi:hypothetical protein
MGSSSHIEQSDENKGRSISKSKRQEKNEESTAEPQAKLTLHHGDPARMMSTSMNNKRSISMCYRFRINQYQQTSNDGLVDRGANGGYCGSVDTRLVSIIPNQYCFVDGIEELNAGKRPIGTFGSVTHTQKGLFIIIMNQYAEGKQQKNAIHSPAQLED